MTEQSNGGSSSRTNATQRALAHPVRAKIYTLLLERTASPSQIAVEVDETVGVVSYHVRTLEKAGLVELDHTSPKRGALQHFYRAHETKAVGVTLRLPPQAADELCERVRQLVADARSREVPERGDDADDATTVTVVLHGSE